MTYALILTTFSSKLQEVGEGGGGYHDLDLYLIQSQNQSLGRTELLKITRQGISWWYTEYKVNTYYC